MSGRNVVVHGANEGRVRRVVEDLVGEIVQVALKLPQRVATCGCGSEGYGVLEAGNDLRRCLLENCREEKKGGEGGGREERVSKSKLKGAKKDVLENVDGQEKKNKKRKQANKPSHQHDFIVERSSRRP